MAGGSSVRCPKHDNTAIIDDSCAEVADQDRQDNFYTLIKLDFVIKSNNNAILLCMQIFEQWIACAQRVNRPLYAEYCFPVKTTLEIIPILVLLIP